MSLHDYQQLQKQSQDDGALLGINLPTLIGAGVNIHSEPLTTEKMLQKVTVFTPLQGWVMYRDEVIMGAELPTRHDIIEAEWANGNSTLKVKLVGSNLFQVTQITKQATGDKLFSEQQVILRNNLKGEYNTALYHCWWQQASRDEHKGRWLPLTQQFVGFLNNKGMK
ncbi:hypothetical protein [Psychromonas arctica]|uniref:hypothetical protein n=1 Tax=Psychromonas arctica TaxID=168275 RepID=UPI002FD72010